ncbi:S9 family peptidase [Bacillaceae bacterium Marseille-Q3522]|nr:S9 family peptidase [Bacillaceae bacterium Marseille-Q3522]
MTITAADLYDLKSVTDPQLAANGNDLTYVVTTIDKEKDTYGSNIYYVNLNEKEKIFQWTFGNDRNTTPRWSPDGEQLLFVSNRSGKNQLYLLQKSGGEAKQLTFCANGASNPVWSPDGKKIAFQTSLAPDESLTEEKSDKKDEKPVPLEVNKMQYKFNGKGFWDGKYSHIVIVDIATGKLEQLTAGEYDYSLQSWSPDGKRIAVTADLNEKQDFSFVSDIYLINVETKEKQVLTSSEGVFSKVSWSPNGRYLTAFGHKMEYKNATYTKLWLYDFESKAWSQITDDELLVGDFVVGDFQQGAVKPGAIWSTDNKSFYFLVTDHGKTIVYFGNISGEVYPALHGKQHVYGFTTAGAGEKAVAAISNPQEVGDLYLVTIATGKLERLTNVNAGFFEEKGLASVEELSFTSSDGLELHGWLMKPPGFTEEKKYPFILEIHGGPHAMYANTYFHEFQVLAAQGYVILYINPRGSLGFGQKFVDAVRGDYGGKDYEDLMEAVDFALEQYDFIDKDRMGVTGGSYGGFMTNWVVGHTNRFKAAVTQRSISNWISFHGVSDIGYFFTDWQIQADLNDIEKLWKHSPLAYVNKIETPLLILHGELDYRCPIEQAEQLYIALKQQEKETKLVRFPESNHELSRSGIPSLRIARLNYILDWFKKYI